MYIFFFFIRSLLSPNALNGISFIEAVKINFDEYLAYIIFLLLIVSAISTLDSTLSSAAKLIVLDLSLLSKTILNGRLVMLIFSILGLIFIFSNTKDLYTAVAVSGTAATFLTSTFILRIAFNISVSNVSLIISFAISIFGSIIYYLEAQNINNLFSSTFELDHKYKTLLFLNIIIIFINFLSALIKKRTS